MNKLTLKITFISFFIFLTTNVFGQVDSLKQNQKVVVTMNNGDEYKGIIVKEDDKALSLKIENGTVNLTKSNIVAIEKYDYEGVFEFANPHDTRYFFGPSAIPIKKGKGYYQNVLVTTNFVNYGIADNISIGGGFEFISTILGQPIWFITPKIGFEVTEKVHLGGGFIMAGFATEGTAVLAYGVGTLGSPETNLSVGIGYGFTQGELSEYPAIMLSGTNRITNSIALLSENYIFPNATGETQYLGIHGLRILSKKNAFDFGVMIIPGLWDTLPALPYAGYVRAF